MSQPAQQMLIQWVAFLACVGVGYFVSGYIKMPENPLLWVLLIAVVFVVGYLPFLAFPLLILGAPVPLNNLLWGLGIGVVVGMMLRRSQRRREE